MVARVALALGIVLGPLACIDRGSFACEADVQCEGPERPGQCVAPGFCAHPDDACPSGLRFGRFAAEALAGTCVEVEAGSGSSGDASGSTGSSGSSGSSESSSSGAPIPDEECDGIDNDGDGLIDEWSPVNAQCNGCDLYQRQGRAYWRCDNGRWTDLQPQCAGFGANLASIQDAEENLFLALRTRSGANWIGLNDIGNEGVHTWVDQEPVTYTNWSGGAPPPDDTDANCGGIDTQGEWSMFNCTNSRPGFCEAPHPD
ncbi:MAG: C-type lectin domain-containing protein [Myxococcales bacterium]|nr:C-type lectin domain-containing protein [Myxococcales bacterium]